MAKVISTERINLYVAWVSLRNMSPNDFTASQLDSVFKDVIPVLEGELGEFKEIDDNIKDINTKFSLEEIDEETANRELNTLNVSRRKLEFTAGREDVKVELSKNAFNDFFQLFEAKGKDWFQIAENYYAFRKALNTGNGKK